jgi:hypothetical protein
VRNRTGISMLRIEGLSITTSGGRQFVKEPVCRFSDIYIQEVFTTSGFVLI